MERPARPKKKRFNATSVVAIIFVIAFGVLCACLAPATQASATLWSLFPPVMAIGLALITKEVYSSLFIGLLAGAMLVAKFRPLKTMDVMVKDGMITSITAQAGIFLFFILLGTMVALINKAGGSAAFGEWAKTHIKTRVGAMLATFLLGVLIFIDDYFNCLTVGAVMRPVTDSHRISRAKLAYLIDATAAPVCMIAPISSWAAAVASYAQKGQGIRLFCRAIPYNYYSLLTLIFIIALSLMRVDYGPMRRYEMNAIQNGDLYTDGERVEEVETVHNSRGKLIDLILPIVVLIGVCVFSLVYVGGIFEGKSFIDAFSETDAATALPWGTLVALVFTIIYLLCRKVITFKDAMKCLPEGFSSMVAPMLILGLATALKNMTSELNAADFVKDVVSGTAGNFQAFLPALIFIIAAFIAFSTGTSWGTFGILIPIVTAIFAPTDPLYVIGISACLAGAVCGDHCSPISDTTIMSSAGAQCNHLNHVKTQLPYAITVAAVSFVSYIVAGFVKNVYVSLGISIVMMLAVLVAIRFIFGDERHPKSIKEG
ncbi:MAG: Na+/H+ antiporter NhaC family protein [Acutalibacteraceae bacterium]|nr:Na+/H+ antiporter NhaC family protein [Acutalibacteraceae bacterium]